MQNFAASAAHIVAQMNAPDSAAQQRIFILCCQAAGRGGCGAAGVPRGGGARGCQVCAGHRACASGKRTNHMNVAAGLMRCCARQLEAADAALLVCHEEAGRAEVKFALATAHVLRLARERLVDKVVKDRHGQIGVTAESLWESGLTGHRCLYISKQKDTVLTCNLLPVFLAFEKAVCGP